MRGKGVEDDGARVNWRELVAFKRSFTDRVPDRIEGADLASGRFAVIERSRDFTLVPWRQVLEARAVEPVRRYIDPCSRSRFSRDPHWRIAVP